jgi:hypothetical protein
MKPKAAQDLSPELKSALGPMMREIESVSEGICEYDHLLESMTRNRYPEAERLKQIKGVRTLIALTDMLTLESVTRDRASRRCTSAKRAILTYEHFWCRLRTTFSAPGESTATRADGA